MLKFLLITLVALALVCGLLALAQAEPTFTAPYLTPEDIQRIDALPIGEMTTLVQPAGDGCNICRCPVVRDSETTIRYLAGCMCTLGNCAYLSPSITYKPSPAPDAEPKGK